MSWKTFYVRCSSRYCQTEINLLNTCYIFKKLVGWVFELLNERCNWIEMWGLLFACNLLFHLKAFYSLIAHRHDKFIKFWKARFAKIREIFSFELKIDFLLLVTNNFLFQFSNSRIDMKVDELKCGISFL